MAYVTAFWDDYQFAQETLGSLMLMRNNAGEDHWCTEQDNLNLSESANVAMLLKIRTDHQHQSILEKFSDAERSELHPILKGLSGLNPLYIPTAEIPYFRLWKNDPKKFCYYEGKGYKVAYTKSPYVYIDSLDSKGFVTYVHAICKTG